jgi:hypothetical protein
MKIKSKDFRVRPGARLKFKECPTKVKPYCRSKKRYKKLLEEHVQALSALQQLHYLRHRFCRLGTEHAGVEDGVENSG